MNYERIEAQSRERKWGGRKNTRRKMGRKAGVVGRMMLQGRYNITKNFAHGK